MGSTTLSTVRNCENSTVFSATWVAICSPLRSDVRFSGTAFTTSTICSRLFHTTEAASLRTTVHSWSCWKGSNAERGRDSSHHTDIACKKKLRNLDEPMVISSCSSRNDSGQNGHRLYRGFILPFFLSSFHYLPPSLSPLALGLPALSLLPCHCGSPLFSKERLTSFIGRVRVLIKEAVANEDACLRTARNDLSTNASRAFHAVKKKSRSSKISHASPGSTRTTDVDNRATEPSDSE